MRRGRSALGTVFRKAATRVRVADRRPVYEVLTMARQGGLMDLIASYNAAIDAVVAFADMPRPLLHVHAGMIIYLGCQLFLGTRRGSLLAVLLTLLLAVAHEVMNRAFHGSWRWENTAGDLVLTTFWPTMCYAVSRFRRWQWAQRAQRLALIKRRTIASVAYG